MLYVLNYIENGRTLTVHLYPVDAANGVIMDGSDDGMMTGNTTTGHRVRVPLDAIVNLSILDVFWRNNQGTNNHSRWTDDQVADHLDRCDRDSSTGEVKTPLRRIDSGGEPVYKKDRGGKIATHDADDDDDDDGQTSFLGRLFG